MPGLEKIDLEDALDDSPQTRSMVALFEQDAQLLKNYIQILRSHCEKVLTAQRDLAAATTCLSQHLRLYEKQTFPLETDSDSVLKATLREIASTLDEVSSLQQVCVAQLGDGMLYPLNRFIEADLTDVFTMMEMFAIASSDMEHSIVKFCKAPKKKDGEKGRQDINEEVYVATKKFHQTALHYYANLNALQYKRKTALLEPMLGYLHALRSVFAVGHESLNTPELETFLSNIGTSVQGVQAELGQETQRTVKKIDTIEQQSQHLYYAESPTDMPYVPANVTLTQKSGYLFMKTKFAGMMTKWEHSYFYTLSSHLMCMSKNELAGSVVLEIDKLVFAQALENEDRRNVFQISSGKKSIVLQALNERERDEWISTIHNIAKESMVSREKPNLHKQASKENAPQKSSFERVQSSSSNASNTSSNNGDTSRVKEAAITPPSPISNLLLETPIQFDLFSPGEDRQRSESMDPPEPIDNLNDASSSDSSGQERTPPFWEVYAVRFLGSMQVQKDRGDRLVFQTIRHIMAARAIHNIFKMHDSHMVITHRTLKILDPSHAAVRAVFPLEDVSFWTTHKDNNRLLGFITRSKSEDSVRMDTFQCHVFEAQLSADEICSSLSTAANIALKALLQRASISESPVGESPVENSEDSTKVQGNDNDVGDPLTSSET